MASPAGCRPPPACAGSTRRAQITVVERSGHVSYANCGLPYFVGGVIEDEEDLLLQTPEQLFERFRLDVRVDTEVTAIDRPRTRVTVRSTLDGARVTIALRQARAQPGRRAGAAADPRLRAGAQPAHGRGRRAPRRRRRRRAATAVVIGAGFIGLETAENLVRQGIAVTVVEAADQVLTPLDAEMAILVAASSSPTASRSRPASPSPRSRADACASPTAASIPAELVVGSIGVRPDTSLAEMAGSSSAPAAASPSTTPTAPVIPTSTPSATRSRRSTPSAAGRRSSRSPTSPTARAGASPTTSPAASAAVAVARHRHREGVRPHRGDDRLEREAPRREAGRPYRAIHSHPMSHAGYYPGARARWPLKLLFDPDDGDDPRRPGRRAARASTSASTCSPPRCPRGLAADELADLELAYAPPFSSAKDPVNMLGYMAENMLSGDCDVVARDELEPARSPPGGPCSTCAPPTEHARRRDSRARQRAPRRRCGSSSPPSATRPSSCTARSASAATPPRVAAGPRLHGPQPRRRLPHLAHVHPASRLADAVATNSSRPTGRLRAAQTWGGEPCARSRRRSSAWS